MILRRASGGWGSRLELRQTETYLPLASPTAAPDVPISRPSENTTKSIPNQTPIVVITIVFIGLVIAFLVIFSIYKHCQMRQTPSHNMSRNCMKSLWSNSGSNTQEYQTPESNENLYSINEHAERGTAVLGSNNAARTFTMSERAASVRSVITLPSYMQTARQTERVLGREGERAGMDVVVEFPKTAQEEEQRREEEMEALYQVRLARRRENELREERRRLRREAEERGEPLTSREIEEYERRINDELQGQSIEELRAQHERLKRQRQRAVSIVSYADIGVARHDGTRLSLPNQDNEHVGLLGDAASMSVSTQVNQRDRPGSTHSMSSNNSVTLHNPIQHSTHSRNPPSSFSRIARHRSTSCNFTQTANYQASSSSPVTQTWRSPRGGLRRASTPTEISHSEGVENIRLSRQNYTQLSAPPRYGPESPNTTMSSSEQPPEYSVAQAEETEQQLVANEVTQATPHSDPYIRDSPNNSQDLAPCLPNLNLESLPIIAVNTSRLAPEIRRKSNRNLT